MIDLTKLDPSEAERIAYAEGFVGTADLFARISGLQCAAQHLLGTLEVLGGDLDDQIVQAMNALHDEVNK